MIRLMLNILDSILREILFREIAERRMRIFGSIVVLPWLVAFVVLFANDTFELVLT